VHEVGGGGGYAAELGGLGRRPVGLGVGSRRIGSGLSEMDGNGRGRNGVVSGESLPRRSGGRGSYTSWQDLSPRSR
jgi:hypothetical protein